MYILCKFTRQFLSNVYSILRVYNGIVLEDFYNEALGYFFAINRIKVYVGVDNAHIIWVKTIVTYRYNWWSISVIVQDLLLHFLYVIFIFYFWDNGVFFSLNIFNIEKSNLGYLFLTQCLMYCMYFILSKCGSFQRKSEYFNFLEKCSIWFWTWNLWLVSICYFVI